ncbi:WD40 repeat-like protein [Meredithblackwellia eburnea MCA 4105]
MSFSPTKASSSAGIGGAGLTNSPSRLALSSLNISTHNSPRQSQSQSLRDVIHKSVHQQKKPLISSSAASALGTKKRSTSPSKSNHSRSRSPTKSSSSSSFSHAAAANQASADNITQEFPRSPTKRNTSSSLAANGGLGRMDVVGNALDSVTGGSATGKDEKRSPSKKGKHYDRYIPSRSASVGGGGDHTGPIPSTDDLTSTSLSSYTDSTSTTLENSTLSASLGLDPTKRILSFFAEPPPPSSSASDGLLTTYRRPRPGHPASSSSSSTSTAAQAASRRRIATAPERVLDAPGLVDDYYLNLLDWSSSNLVAIGLSESVYVWNAESGEVSLLCSVGSEEGGQEGDDYIASVKFAEDGSYLAVGLSSGPIKIYDLTTSSLIRTMSGHLSRVPSLSWSGAVLSSGCRTGEIWNSDVRVAQHKVAELRGHRGEVCGLEWRKEVLGGLSGGGQGLLASGGNDNIVHVWDGRMTSAPKMTKTNHTAAVKALAWCPWNSSLLATGGGSSDRTIHFWNTTTSARLNSLPTPSQVTSLIFNPHSREILSSHGIPDHQLSIYSYPTLNKVADIPQAHETRILHSCLSPDGTTVATASSDENLKFWKVFERKGKEGAKGKGMMGEKDVEERESVGGARKGKTGITVR